MVADLVAKPCRNIQPKSSSVLTHTIAIHGELARPHIHVKTLKDDGSGGPEKKTGTGITANLRKSPPLTSKNRLPRSSNRYCCLPSTIMTGFLKWWNMAASVEGITLLMLGGGMLNSAACVGAYGAALQVWRGEEPGL